MDQLIDAAIQSMVMAMRFMWRVATIIFRLSWQVGLWLSRNPTARAQAVKLLFWIAMLVGVVLLGWGSVEGISWVVNGVANRSPTAILVLVLLILLIPLGSFVLWKKSPVIRQRASNLRFSSSSMTSGSQNDSQVTSMLTIEDIEILPTESVPRFGAQQTPPTQKDSILDDIEIEDDYS